MLNRRELPDLRPNSGLTAGDLSSGKHREDQGRRDRAQLRRQEEAFELDSYKRADIDTYTTRFRLGAANLPNVLVDGFNGTVHNTNAQAEVVLDIDLILALAPKLKSLYVYQTDNNSVHALDEYQKIADDLAPVVSISWGYPESEVQALAPSFPSFENQIFFPNGSTYGYLYGYTATSVNVTESGPAVGATIALQAPLTSPPTGFSAVAGEYRRRPQVDTHAWHMELPDLPRHFQQPDGWIGRVGHYGVVVLR